MIECYFDCSSPWTYLGFHNIQPLAAELKVPIRWRPILVGGVFNSVNPSVYASREKPVPAKRDYMLKDLQDWARSSRLKIAAPSARPWSPTAEIAWSLVVPTGNDGSGSSIVTQSTR